MTDISANHPLHGLLFGAATAAAAKALFGFDNTKALIGGVVVGGGAYAYMSKFGHSLPTANHPAKLSSYSGSAAPKQVVGGGVSQAPTSLYSPALTARLAELRAQLPNSGPTLEERVAALRSTLLPPPSGSSVGTTFSAWYGSSKA
jgi:hypothetical protein